MQHPNEPYRLEVLVWDAELKEIDSVRMAQAYYRERIRLEGNVATLAAVDIRTVALKEYQSLQIAAEVAAELLEIELGGLMRMTRDEELVRWERVERER